VKLVDANVLLYSIDRSATHHEAAHDWLETSLNGRETLALPWVSLLAFVRLSTNPAVYPHPLESGRALDIVDLWLSSGIVTTAEPGGGHIGRLRDLLTATGHGGNLVNDAHLAAIALDHDATVVTFDSDFGRFPGVKWERPGS
jgi:hypothetical protein